MTQKFLGMNLKHMYTQNLHMNILSSIIHISQKIEIDAMNGEINVVYSYDEILFSYEMKLSIDKCYNMDGP